MQQQMMLSQHSCPLANTCNNDINMSLSSSEEDKEEEDIIHTNAVERISLLPPLLILQQ